MILSTEGSTPSCRPNQRDLGATGVRILMRVGMSFSVSLSCAWFAIMNLHYWNTQYGMCGRNIITYIYSYSYYGNTLMSYYLYGHIGVVSNIEVVL